MTKKEKKKKDETQEHRTESVLIRLTPELRREMEQRAAAKRWSFSLFCSEAIAYYLRAGAP